MCRETVRLRKFSIFQATKNMCIPCIYSVISHCIGLFGGVSQRTSRSNVLNSLQKRIVKKILKVFFQNSRRIFKEARILKIDKINKLNLNSYMYNILKHGKCPKLGPSLYIT